MNLEKDALSGEVKMLVPTMLKWTGPNGVCKVFKVPGSILMSGCFGAQTFSNAKKESLIEFCRSALKNPSQIRQYAREHKGDIVSKEDLHNSATALKNSGVLDPHTWKNLMHMTRECQNCAPERLYYRLKNFFGTDREYLVDQIKFKRVNPEFEKTISGFLMFCKVLEKQKFTPV